MFRDFLSWLGCKINKILALLSIFVLSMLLSCAFGRTFTKEQIANFIANSENLSTNVEISQEIVNNIKGQMAYWQTCSDWTSSYEGYYVFGYSKYQHYFFFVYITGSSTSYLEYPFRQTYGGSQTINGQSYQPIYIYNTYNAVSDNTMHLLKYDPLNNIITQQTNIGSWTTTTFSFGTSNYNNAFLYTDKYLGKGSNLTSLTTLDAGTLKPGESIFNENYITSEKWEFQSSWADTIHLSGDNTVDYYVVDPSYIYTVLGTLQDSSLCTGAAYEILAFNKSTSTWEAVYDWGEYFTSSDPISNYFTTGDINGIPTSSIKLRSNIVIPDTIIHFTFSRGYSEEDLNKQIDVAFYVRGSHSVINNGVADYDSTFSDPDYYNDYQYEVDNLVNMSFDDTLNDVNDNLSNDSEVTQIVSDFFGTSGEVLESLGYVDYSSQNPYGNVFLTFVNGVRQVFLDSGAVTLSCTVHGQTFSFNSDDFQNPSTVLKVFTTSTCIFVTLYFYFQLAFNFVNAMTDGDFLGLTEVVRKYAGLIKYM